LQQELAQLLLQTKRAILNSLSDELNTGLKKSVLLKIEAGKTGNSFQKEAVKYS